MEFILPVRDVATLILLNIAVADIVEGGEIMPDVMDELRSLSPQLNELVMSIKERSKK